MSSFVSCDMIDEYQRDGVTLIPGLFRAHLENLRLGVEGNMSDPGPYAAENLKEGENGRFFDDYCNWNRISEYRSFIFYSNISKIAASLMNSRKVNLFHEHVLVKEKGSKKRTPWHQDQGYYCVTGSDNVSIWIPLDLSLIHI